MYPLALIARLDLHFSYLAEVPFLRFTSVATPTNLMIFFHFKFMNNSETSCSSSSVNADCFLALASKIGFIIMVFAIWRNTYIVNICFQNLSHV